MRINKKGVTPVVSTVLLIMIVVILAVIILLWSRGFIKEKILKFDKPVENVCSEVGIKTFINDDNSYGFTNTGNVPIYSVNLKTSNSDGSSTIDSIKTSANPGISVMLGETGTYQEGNEIKIIPVLLGKTKAGAVKEYTCPENTAIVV